MEKQWTSVYCIVKANLFIYEYSLWNETVSMYKYLIYEYFRGIYFEYRAKKLLNGVWGQKMLLLV